MFLPEPHFKERFGISKYNSKFFFL